MLYLKYAAKLGYKSAVVRTPDTDIFFILLHHAQSITLTVFLDMGTGKHRQVVNASKAAESLGVNYCNMLLGLHAFTGEDVTSAFNPLLPRHRLHQNVFTKIKIPACYRLNMKIQKKIF